MTTRLNEERSQVEWLQCLQAAATLVSVTSTRDEDAIEIGRKACRIADLLLEEYRIRCEYF